MRIYFKSQQATEAIAIVIDLTSHFPHQLIFLETKFKGTHSSHNFKITFAAKRSNLSVELPLDTKIATSERMTMVNHTNIKESILLKNKNRPARRKTNQSYGVAQQPPKFFRLRNDLHLVNIFSRNRFLPMQSSRKLASIGRSRPQST